MLLERALEHVDKERLRRVNRPRARGPNLIWVRIFAHISTALAAEDSLNPECAEQGRRLAQSASECARALLASQPAWRRTAKVDALHCALSIVPIALSCCRPRQSPDGNVGGAMPSMFAEAWGSRRAARLRLPGRTLEASDHNEPRNSFATVPAVPRGGLLNKAVLASSSSSSRLPKNVGSGRD